MLLGIFLTTGSIAGHGQKQQTLLRPDGVWAFGYDQTTYSEEFGLTILDLTGSKVIWKSPDSISAFAFNRNVVNFYTPQYRLDGNGCALVRNFTDTVDLTFKNYPPQRFQEYCEEYLPRTQAHGYQHILPMGDNVLAYSSEVKLRNANNPGFYIAGYNISLLDENVLRDSVDISNFGAVLKSYSFTLGDTLLRETYDYVPDLHGGWWGVAKPQEAPLFFRFRLTLDTVEVLPPIMLGETGSDYEQLTTRLEFAPDGSRFASVSSLNGISICDFDRADANIARTDLIPLDFTPHVLGRTDFDIAWSASGRFLYVANDSMLHQFDTYADNVAGSVVRLSGDYQTFPHTSYKEIERGPDCRIYVAAADVNRQDLSVIDKPDQKGAACALKPSQLYIRRYHFGAIPNSIPDYHLYARTRVDRGLPPIYDTAVCNPNIGPPAYYDWLTATETPPTEALALTVYPNPARSNSTIQIYGIPEGSASGGAFASYVARLVDASGRQVAETRAMDGGVGEVPYPIPDLPAGTYFLQVGSTAEGRYTTVTLIVQ